ncbi:MAG TPA: hypothetical protein VKJ67_07970 [Methylomirabilota bacterium]|nr:hypothetical protein [Methylomirabilota bacterium]
MTTQAVAVLPGRGVRDALLAALAGLVAPQLVALAWSLLASVIWGPGPRLAAFMDPSASPPMGYHAGALLFAVALGALLGGALAWGLTRRAALAWWGLWAAFAVGVVLSAGVASLRQPVLLLFIAASALGFRAGARR